MFKEAHLSMERWGQMHTDRRASWLRFVLRDLWSPRGRCLGGRGIPTRTGGHEWQLDTHSHIHPQHSPCQSRVHLSHKAKSFTYLLLSHLLRHPPYEGCPLGLHTMEGHPSASHWSGSCPEKKARDWKTAWISAGQLQHSGVSYPLWAQRKSLEVSSWNVFQQLLK